jgi:hypothetical protein
VIPPAFGRFREIWIGDFEFADKGGEPVKPYAFVAIELRSGKLVRLLRPELLRMQRAPIPTGDNALFVGFVANAEIHCFKALGWPLPRHVICLAAEHKAETCGLYLPLGNSLLGAAALRGVSGGDADEKHRMQKAIADENNWPNLNPLEALDYCEGDVRTTAKIFETMAPHLPMAYALFRGEFVRAVGIMEYVGTPVDGATWHPLLAGWEEFKHRLITDVDAKYGVYVNDHFNEKRFAALLERHGILEDWPRTPTGKPSLEMLGDMSRTYPFLRELHQLRKTTDQLDAPGLLVGQDNRNRCSLWPFSTITARCAPSTTEFVFFNAAWFRFLIMPPPGSVLIYADWSAQELGLAAWLSQDPNMIEAYRSGDPYLHFAKMIGLAPSTATKATHGIVRELVKVLMLGIGYGMREHGLAPRLGVTIREARRLLDLHRQVFAQFWRWSDAIVSQALWTNRQPTMFGWEARVRPRRGDHPGRIGLEVNQRALRNFPMQAHAAIMLQAATIAAIRCGLNVCATVHDALLIEASTRHVNDVINALLPIMRKASEVIMGGGFSLRADTKIVQYGQRLGDNRGVDLWQKVRKFLLNRHCHNLPKDIIATQSLH